MTKTVLIVEDNPSQAEMLRAIVLEVNPGAKIFVTKEVGEAYQFLMEHTVDVFLTDIVLDVTKPGDAAGVRLVEHIRQVPKYQFTPVIFVTSLEDPESYAYRDLHCFGYIEKPFAPERIRMLLRQAMQFQSVQEEKVLHFRRDGILYPIKVSNLVYAENINRIMHFHLKDQSELEIPYITCRQLLEETDSPKLIQCNRNTVFQADFVENIDFSNRYISLKHSDMQLEIGITFKKKVEEKLKNADQTIITF